MAAGDTFQKIQPSDQLILSAAGDVVGLRNRHGSGQDLRFDPASVAITGGTIAGVMLDGIPVGVSQKLPKWRAALAGVRAKTGYARIACVGDSETYGNQSGVSTNLPQTSYPTRLAEILNFSVPAISASFFGDGNWGSAVVTADPRLSLGGWSVAAGPSTVGGSPFTATGAGAPLAFSPGVATDTVDIWTWTNSGLGSFTVNVDGGASLGTVVESGSAATVKQTFNYTAGTHTINAVWSAANNAFVVGMDAYLSTTKSVRVFNMGRGSALSSYWNSPNAPFDPQATLKAIAPDLTIIMLGVNDWQNAVSVATFTANMQALITAAKLSGDVLLLTQVPSSPSNGIADSVQQPFVQAVYALGGANAVPVVDINYRFGGSYAAGPQWYSPDHMHPSSVGYAEIAASVAKAIL